MQIQEIRDKKEIIVVAGITTIMNGLPQKQTSVPKICKTLEESGLLI